MRHDLSERSGIKPSAREARETQNNKVFAIEGNQNHINDNANFALNRARRHLLKGAIADPRPLADAFGHVTGGPRPIEPDAMLGAAKHAEEKRPDTHQSIPSAFL
ncbi:MAG: hypothetical protein P4L68_08105 [Methylovirgula sp.]|nr:hypothetical protein [Methylovirgula sp.]